MKLSEVFKEEFSCSLCGDFGVTIEICPSCQIYKKKCTPEKLLAKTVQLKKLRGKILADFFWGGDCGGE